MPYKDDLIKAVKESGGKVLELLGEPQRILLNNIAKGVGAVPASDSTDDSSRAIIEKTADYFNLPKDSLSTKIAKEVGNLGLQYASDPLSLIPGEKIFAGAGKLANIAEKSPYTEKVVNLLREAYAQNKLDVNPETLSKVEKLILGKASKEAVKDTEKFGKTIYKIPNESEKLGEVIIKAPKEVSIGSVKNLAPEAAVTTIGDKSGILTNVPAANAPITMDEIRRIKNNRGY